jgi:phosphonate transport system substrate-binding protein
MDMLWSRGRAFRSPTPSASERRGPLLVAGLFAAALLVWHVQAARADDPVPTGLDAYRLGVLPYVPVLMIDRIYGPVAAQLAEDLGRPVHLKTKPNFDKFAEELKRETYDIILVHPFFYVEAHDMHDYVPLARVEEPMSAILLVREDDRLQTLADLAGKTIGLPPARAAVTELVKASLLEIGLVPGVNVTLQHHRTKQSCLQAVAIGRADACGLSPAALSQFDPNNNFKLRQIFESDAISNFVFAAHARVPDADLVNISQSILAWPFTAKGRNILAGGGWSRFVVARDQDYDEVRRHLLRLQKLAQR